MHWQGHLIWIEKQNTFVNHLPRINNIFFGRVTCFMLRFLQFGFTLWNWGRWLIWGNLSTKQLKLVFGGVLGWYKTITILYDLWVFWPASLLCYRCVEQGQLSLSESKKKSTRYLDNQYNGMHYQIQYTLF